MSGCFRDFFIIFTDGISSEIYSAANNSFLAGPAHPTDNPQGFCFIHIGENKIAITGGKATGFNNLVTGVTFLVVAQRARIVFQFN